MNKGKLLASTVLVSAAAVMAASGAVAKVKITGTTEHWIGKGEEAAAQSEIDLKADAEMHFSFSKKLNNGMKLTGKFEKEVNATATGYDEASVTLSGGFGKLIIGNNDVASSHVGSISVVGPVGIIKSDASDWVAGSYETNNVDSDLGAGDNQSIAFFTPKMGGLQIGVSYTPDSSDSDDMATTGAHNWISGVVKYSGKAGKSKVNLGIGYTQNEATDSGANADGDSISIAGSIVNGPYTISVAYSDESVGGADDDDIFIGGAVKYKMGKGATMSIGYGKGVEDETSGVDGESSVTSLSYEKSLGAGVSWGSSIAWADIDQDGTANDVNGMMIVTGIKAKF